MGRLLLWLLLAWPIPALLAGALGWKGVWGSGSAVTDYLIPIPVAGGTFHTATLVLITGFLLAQRSLPPGIAGLARGLLLALTGLGAALLVDWEQQRISENPVGLFLFSDSLLAQLFLSAFGGRSPEGRGQWAGALVLGLGLPAAAAAIVASTDPRANEPFLPGTSLPGPERGDEHNFVFTRLKPGSPEFRAAAAAYAARLDPKENVNSDAVAIFFVPDLKAAKMADATGAVMTYCMYQDETPARWLPGAGDCFSGHENLSERFRRVFENLDRSIPQEERVRTAKALACQGVRTSGKDNAITRMCGRPGPSG